MELGNILQLQGTLFALMLIGAFMKVRGIIDDAGKRCLSDMCIQIVIPANIFKSFLIEFNADIFKACAGILAVGAISQVVCLVVNRYLFNSYPEQRRKVLQYCTIVSMSGFLGNPIAEGIYGSLGVMYASLFMIPMRIVMWSVGTSYFVADAHMDKRKVIWNVMTHPCLIAVYLGLFAMLTQIQLPGVITSTARYVSNCNSALSMFIIGTMLPDVDLRTIICKDTLLFSLLRLVLLPLTILCAGRIIGLTGVALSVSVLMIGMPAGATAGILAARYNSDAPFATKCVVSTTLISMITIPIWCWLIG